MPFLDVATRNSPPHSRDRGAIRLSRNQRPLRLFARRAVATRITGDCRGWQFWPSPFHYLPLLALAGEMVEGRSNLTVRIDREM